MSTKPFCWLERGPIQRVRAILVTAGIDRDFVPRAKEALHRILPPELIPLLEVEQRDLPSAGSGLALTIIVDADPVPAGFSALGKPGKPLERVIEEAANELVSWWRAGAPVDPHLADQLALPAALTAGTSQWRTSEVTEHLRTVLWLIPQFLDVEAGIEGNVITLRGR